MKFAECMRDNGVKDYALVALYAVVLSTSRYGKSSLNGECQETVEYEKPQSARASPSPEQ
jgi:hypothetical protein